METVMKDIQAQPWWQYEDDITMFSEQAVQYAMSKELSQLISKPLRWVITQRPANDGTKDIKCRFCGKGFSQYTNNTDIQTFEATPNSTAMRFLLTIAILKQCTFYKTDVASSFLNTPIEQEVLVQPPKESLSTHTLLSMTKALYGLRTSPKQRQEHLSTILQHLGFTRLKSDACVFINTKSTICIMAYVDDLQPFLQQFQQHLELKHTSQLTKSTPLEVLGKPIELQDTSICCSSSSGCNNTGKLSISIVSQLMQQGSLTSFVIETDLCVDA
eukprot:230249-Amphidinium_carterae.1